MTLAREKFIRRGVIRPGATAARGDPTPATWIDQPTLRLLGNEEALSAKHEREARARRSAERDA